MPSAIVAIRAAAVVAAVVAVGEDRAEQVDPRGPAVVDTCSRMYPDSLDTMGWKVGRNGFALILSTDLPDLIVPFKRPLYVSIVTAFAEFGGA